MSELIKLLDNLPSYFDKESYPLSIAKVENVIAVTVNADERTLIVKDSYEAYTFNIYDKNIGQIKQMLIAAGYTLSGVTDLYDNLKWFVLCDGVFNDCNLYFEQSYNRRFMAGVAQFLLDCSADYMDALNEAYFYKSRSFWLDLWGKYFGHARLPAETDSAFFNRIMFEILSPKNNNKSLEKLVEHLIAYKVTIVELGKYGREMFYTNRPESLTNVKDDLLQKNYVDYPDTHNAFAVLVHSGNINNLGAYEKSVILRVINKYKATGNFPIYFAPLGILHTNIAGEIVNDTTKSYNVSPTTKAWVEVTIT